MLQRKTLCWVILLTFCQCCCCAHDFGGELLCGIHSDVIKLCDEFKTVDSLLTQTFSEINLILLTVVIPNSNMVPPLQ